MTICRLPNRSRHRRRSSCRARPSPKPPHDVRLTVYARLARPAQAVLLELADLSRPAFESCADGCGLLIARTFQSGSRSAQAHRRSIETRSRRSESPRNRAFFERRHRYPDRQHQWLCRGDHATFSEVSGESCWRDPMGRHWRWRLALLLLLAGLRSAMPLAPAQTRLSRGPWSKCRGGLIFSYLVL